MKHLYYRIDEPLHKDTLLNILDNTPCWISYEENGISIACHEEDSVFIDKQMKNFIEKCGINS